MSDALVAAEWQYRCAECGDGSRLYACAYAVASGPLAPNGKELVTHDDVSETELAEDSIECGDHPGSVIEYRADGDGVWCRWQLCETCDGTGREPNYPRARCKACAGRRGIDVPAPAAPGGPGPVTREGEREANDD